MSDKKKIILIGAGGHCKACIDVVELENIFHIEGILDLEENVGKEVLGYKIIGTDSLIEELIKQGFYFLITIGQIKSSKKRKEVFEKLNNLHALIATVKSPLAHISRHAKLGKGCIIMHGAIIQASVNIGENCILNDLSLIEHDSTIGNHCHISTGAIVNGGVTIEDEVFLGSQSTTLQNSRIPQGKVISAGSFYK